ncbi:MAG: DNA cytosine methyltransferase [Bacilli bacterium]
MIIPEATKQGYAIAYEGDSINLEHPNSTTRRGRVGKQQAQTLTTSCNQGVISEDYRIRKITPLESWRLMGIEDEDFYKAQSVCSNAQLYKQAGNGIVVDVLVNIFKQLY